MNKRVSLKKNLIVILLASLVIATFLTGCNSKSESQPSPASTSIGSAIITDRGDYYEVVLNLAYRNNNHYQVGEDYGKALIKAVPEIESLLDSYLDDVAKYLNDYSKLLAGAKNIMPQIPNAYREEIDGMATCFSGGNTDVSGDGKISKMELYTINLMGTLIEEGCAGISVFGSRSDTGQTLSGHVLDWWQGTNNQLAKLHAVTFIKNGTHSIGLVGVLAYVSGGTAGFNRFGIFGANLTSDTGLPRVTEGANDSGFDFRYQLENSGTISGIYSYLSTAPYSNGEVWLLADKNAGQFFENNLQEKRALRSWNSPLNPGIEWGFTDAVASVNSFLLSGNTDNHFNTTWDNSNQPRWASFRAQLTAKGERVTWEELKEILGYNGGSCDDPETGDIYNALSYQIVVFNSATRQLEVAFRPKNAVETNPDKPIFQTIKLPMWF